MGATPTPDIIRVYLDSGVLLAAWRLGGSTAVRLEELLLSVRYEIVTSRLVEMETLPQAIYHRRWSEVDFYQTVLSNVSGRVELDQPLVDRAFELGCEYGVMGVDALHAAAAERARVDAFVSTEKTTKPLYRVESIRPLRLDDFVLELD